MRLADVEELQGKTGWLRVSKITVQAAGNVREELILTCFEDVSGKAVSPETAQRLFMLPPKKWPSSPKSCWIMTAMLGSKQLSPSVK